MKNINLSSFLILFAMSFFLSSCGGGEHEHAHDTDGNHFEQASDKTGKEYTSAFVCPMYCKGSGNHEAGKCPACKMDYVANESYKPDGNQHDTDEVLHVEEEGHEGHNH